jgi:hypothetical protein
MAAAASLNQAFEKLTACDDDPIGASLASTSGIPSARRNGFTPPSELWLAAAVDPS